MCMVKRLKAVAENIGRGLKNPGRVLMRDDCHSG